MPYCRFCGSSVKLDARFCAACGKPANTSVSSNPSHPIASANIGASLSKDNPPALSNAGASQPPAGVAYGTQIREGAIVRRRPAGVTVIAILAFTMTLAAGFTGLLFLGLRSEVSTAGSLPLAQLLFHLVPVIGEGQREILQNLGLAILEVLAISAIYATVSYGLWRTYSWGRIVTIVVSVFVVIHAAVMVLASVGTLMWHLFAIALNIWMIVYLLKSHVRKAFVA